MNRRLDHEKLEVYQASLELIAWLEPILQAVAQRDGSSRAVGPGQPRDSTGLGITITIKERDSATDPRRRIKGVEFLAGRPTLPGVMIGSSVEQVGSSLRAGGRRRDELRPVRFQHHIAPHATGSTLIEWGETRVICGVTIEETVPKWMKDQNVSGGWITAEYSMLPYSTLQRKQRDISKGKIDGRSQEIQRLIGRSLRAAIDLEKVGPRTIWVDCDVLQADGGTRTAAITGASVALALAVRKLIGDGKLGADPLLHPVAAVSAGLVQGQAMLDLCYTEDVAASVDMNVVMNGHGEFIEIQGSGEEATFSEGQLAELIALGQSGIRRLVELQREALA